MDSRRFSTEEMAHSLTAALLYASTAFESATYRFCANLIINLQCPVISITVLS